MGLKFDTTEVDRALAKLAMMDTTPVMQAGVDELAERMAGTCSGTQWQFEGRYLRRSADRRPKPKLGAVAVYAARY